MTTFRTVLGAMLLFSACGSEDTEWSSDPSGTDPAAMPSPMPAQPPLVVHESTAPTCNDLPQMGSAVPVTSVAGEYPAAQPLTVLEPGIYVMTAFTHYENWPSSGTAKGTVYVTPSRYYVRYDLSAMKQVSTSSWSLADGQLTRDWACSSVAPRTTDQTRIDASQNGFTVYGNVPAYPYSVRFERVQ